jgi:hypothetical protein
MVVSSGLLVWLFCDRDDYTTPEGVNPMGTRGSERDKVAMSE